MKIIETVKLHIIPFLVSLALFLLGRTLRLREAGNVSASKTKRKNGPAIFASWHHSILISVFFYRNNNINGLISMNRDGEYISRVMKNFGFSSTRGSTSREGFRAFLGLKKVLQAGNYVAVTPDGPRGPKHKAQIGAVYLAKQSGVPVSTFAFDADKKWVLKSWDGHIIPKPFSKGVFLWGKDITVPDDADEAVLEKKRLELENELNRLTGEAAGLCRSNS